MMMSMRGICAAMVAMAFGIALIGCQSDSSKHVSAEALDARMLAAKQVSDPQQRDLALKQTALDAARAQRVETARRALADISDSRMRDETASRTAMVFNDNKLYVQARELAAMINDQQLKDQTLMHMAAAPAQANR